jgi:serine/threonine protein phosphatase PrpC
MTLTIEHGVLTDVGRMRDNNEDAFDVIVERDFYVVADGMGGHASGQVASRVAVESIRRYVTELYRVGGQEYSYPSAPGATEPERLVSNALQWANERVFIESMKERELEGMGTTVVAVMAVGRHAVLGHVGDSRIYRFRDGHLEQLTRDHSLLNHYIEKGKITTEEEARSFKETNVIVKAVGLKDYVEPTVQMVDRRPGDIFLLCSDGLSDQVDDATVAQVIASTPVLRTACQRLVDLSNRAGGKDNCTVMLLRVTEGQDEPIAKTIRREVPRDDEDEDTKPTIAAVVLPDDEETDTDTQPEMPVFAQAGPPPSLAPMPAPPPPAWPAAPPDTRSPWKK